MEIEKPLLAQAQLGFGTGTEDHLCQSFIWLHLFPSHSQERPEVQPVGQLILWNAPSLL